MTGDKRKLISFLACPANRIPLRGGSLLDYFFFSKKLKSYKLQARRGFTLVEMLVAMSVFVIAATAATDLYVSASKMSRAVRSRERLQNEARFAFETISREIRTGTIDYQAYGGSVPMSGDTLNLFDGDGNSEIFRISTQTSECAENGFPCLLICDSGTCSALTTSKIVWDEVKFYVSPQNDPFLFDPVSGNYAASVQPHVEVFAKLRMQSALPEETVSISLQTAITSRVYKR